MTRNFNIKSCYLQFHWSLQLLTRYSFLEIYLYLLLVFWRLRLIGFLWRSTPLMLIIFLYFYCLPDDGYLKLWYRSQLIMLQSIWLIASWDSLWVVIWSYKSKLVENTSIFYQLLFDFEVSGFELERIKLSIQAQILKGVIQN